MIQTIEQPRMHALKLFGLYIFWNWGILIFFFSLWCVACYLYFDVVTNAVLPPNLQDDLMNTPFTGKVMVVVIAGRKVTLKINRKIQLLKAKYIKGD